MAGQQKVIPVKLIVGILYSDKELLSITFQKLISNWGKIDFTSESFESIEEHKYYKNEISGNIKRIFISFEELVKPEEIVNIKEKSNQIEIDLAKQTKDSRPINLDPGYMDFNKLVLASYKYSQQKIHIKNGVWADITLFYKKGNFIPFPWTFPDFSINIYYNTLIKIRELYKKSFKEIL